MKSSKHKNYHKNYYNIEIPYGNGMLLYNILNKNFVFLNSRYTYLYQNIEELRKSDNQEILKEFLDAEFVLDNSIDERMEYLRNFHLHRWFSKKLLFTIVPTTACNFRCPYCFERGIKYVSMDASIIEKSTKFIEERIKIFKPEEVSVSYYGGEPLLELNKIFKFGYFFKSLQNKYDFRLGADIVTNGYLLSINTVFELYNKANIKSAQITLDGPPRIHDARRFLRGKRKTFDAIYKNISEILASDLDFIIRIRVNVDKTNISYLEELLKILSKLPNREEKLEIYFSPVTGESDRLHKGNRGIFYSEEEFGKVYVNTIIPLLFKYKFDYERYPDISYVFCAGITPFHYLIDSDGSIKKCFDLVGREKESVGHVESYNDGDKRVLKWELFEPLGKECLDCKYLPICGGGCPYKKMQRGENVCEPWRYVLKDLLVKIYELKSSKKVGQ